MKLIPVIFCLLFLPDYFRGFGDNVIHKQHNAVGTPREGDKELERIRIERSRINSSKLKTKIRAIGESECVDKGRVVCFSEHNSVVKIELSFSSLDSRYTTRFYFKDGALIYIDDLSQNSQPLSNAPLRRGYYIRKNAVISQVENHRKVTVDNSSEELLEWANRLIQAVISGDFKGLLCGI